MAFSLTCINYMVLRGYRFIPQRGYRFIPKKIEIERMKRETR
jgi:hypothetical protein